MTGLNLDGLSPADLRTLGNGAHALTPSAPARRAQRDRTAELTAWRFDALDRADTDGLDLAEEEGIRVQVVAVRTEAADPVGVAWARATEAEPLASARLALRLRDAVMPPDADPCDRCGRPLRLRRGYLRTAHPRCL